MTKKKTNPHSGSTLADFLKVEGRHEEATGVAIKRVIAWQIDEFIRRMG